MRHTLHDIDVIDFYGDLIPVGYSEELKSLVVPLKLIVEDHLGLNWEVQRRKLADHKLYDPINVSGECFKNTAADVFSFNPANEYVCLRIKELSLFLCQISYRKVPEAVQDRLVVYQLECMDVLTDYFLNGFAINRRVTPFSMSSDLRECIPFMDCMRRFTRACESYAEYITRQTDEEVTPEDIKEFVYAFIFEIDGRKPGDPMSGASEFIMTYILKACTEVLLMLLREDVHALDDDLMEVFRTNISKVREHAGGDLLTVKSPYSPFPGANDGLPRTLIKD